MYRELSAPDRNSFHFNHQNDSESVGRGEVVRGADLDDGGGS
jgi:hypothetical protein